MTSPRPFFSLLRSLTVRARQGYVHNTHGASDSIIHSIAIISTRNCYSIPSSKRLIHHHTANNTEASNSSATDNAPPPPAPAPDNTASSQSLPSQSSSTAAAAEAEIPSQASPSTQPLTFKVSISPSTTSTGSDKPSNLPFLQQFTPPSSRVSRSPVTPAPSPSTSSLASSLNPRTVQLPTQIPPTPPLANYPYKYHVARTASAQLPIYQTRKRGGNLLLTLIRKITGDPVALRDDLVEELDLLKEREEREERETASSTDAPSGANVGGGGGGKHVKKTKKSKYARPVKVDEVCWIKRECGHVVIKGHHAPRVIDFLKAKGF